MELPRMEGSFGFSNVQLVRSEDNLLGIGSYGSVYKAKCDQLVCAAKILHPILAGHRILERFQREIRFLSSLRHPNVIQYLGSYTHPEVGPVLFMELMDESLTSFLERQTSPLSLHVQVDVSHDVAQALFHLHHHGVLHRDLSSNNVLLVGTKRAKVTDFGMAKFLDSNPSVQTGAPGTPVYMSPEALAEPPAYTTKLDIFSCGVLLVQILTCRFPDPGPRTQSSRMGSAEILVVKPEVERRKNHLDLIPPSHSLLEVALDCLKDKEAERLTAEELCSQLIALKESPAYTDSVKKELLNEVGGSGEAMLRQEIEQLHSQNEQLVQQNIQKDDLIREKNVGLERNNGEIREAEAAIQQLQNENASLQRELEDMRRLQHDQIQNGSLNLQWREGPNAPETISGQSVAVSKGKVYFCDGTSQGKLLMYDTTTEQWDILPECPDGRRNFSIAVVDGFLTAIGGKHEKSTKKLLSLLHNKSGASPPSWGEKFPKMKYHHLNPAVVSTNVSLIVAGGGGPDEVKGPVEVMNIPNQQWSKLSGLPFVLTRATAAIYEENVYIGGGYRDPGLASKSVLKVKLTSLMWSHPESAASLLAKKLFNSDGRQSPWKEVANLPLKMSSLVTFHNQLLAVGGGRADMDCDAMAEVREYDHRTESWTPIGRMRMRRSGCLVAVIPGDRLMVCGGDTPDGQTDSTEIASIAN